MSTYDEYDLYYDGIKTRPLSNADISIEECLSVLTENMANIEDLPEKMVVNEQFWLAVKENKLYPDLNKVSKLKKLDFLFISRVFNFDYYLPYYEEKIKNNSPFSEGFFKNSTFPKGFLDNLSKSFLLELIKNNPFHILNLNDHERKNIDLHLMAFNALPETLILMTPEFRQHNRLIYSALTEPPNILKKWMFSKKESYLEKLIPAFTDNKQRKHVFMKEFTHDTSDDIYELAIKHGDIHAIVNVRTREEKLHFIKKYIVLYPELAQYLQDQTEYVVMNAIMDNQQAIEFLPQKLKETFSKPEEWIRIRNSLILFENRNQSNLAMLKAFENIKKEITGGKEQDKPTLLTEI